MLFMIIAFVLSMCANYLLVRSSSLHGHITDDSNMDGVQKFHTRPVPRVGGLGLVIGALCALFFYYHQTGQTGVLGLMLLFSAIPAVGFGILEDTTGKVGVRLRLLATVSSAGMAGYFLGAWLSSVQVLGIDDLMSHSPFFAVVITCFAVTGIVNSFNIIDGYNGLSGMVGVIILLCLALVAYQLGDLELMNVALVMVASILGFLVFNYPRGLIFLGDGGAYLIGFWVAEVSILLTARYPQVSKWYPLLLCCYPAFETLFTIYRRLKAHRSNPLMPDAGHLHQLIYRRVVRWSIGSKRHADSVARNSLTAPFLWALTTVAAAPAVLFWDNAWALRGFTLLFALLYLYLYRSLIKFKTPRWLILTKKRFTPD